MRRSRRCSSGVLTNDESVCEGWAEDVYFQLFCGEEYFQPPLPCDATNLVRFR
jgi:IS5 family transposase